MQRKWISVIFLISLLLFSYGSLNFTCGQSVATKSYIAEDGSKITLTILYPNRINDSSPTLTLIVWVECEKFGENIERVYGVEVYFKLYETDSGRTYESSAIKCGEFTSEGMKKSYNVTFQKNLILYFSVDYEDTKSIFLLVKLICCEDTSVWFTLDKTSIFEYTSIATINLQNTQSPPQSNMFLIIFHS